MIRGVMASTVAPGRPCGTLRPAARRRSKDSSADAEEFSAGAIASAAAASAGATAFAVASSRTAAGFAAAAGAVGSAAADDCGIAAGGMPTVNEAGPDGGTALSMTGAAQAKDARSEAAQAQAIRILMFPEILAGPGDPALGRWSVLIWAQAQNQVIHRLGPGQVGG